MRLIVQNKLIIRLLEMTVLIATNLIDYHNIIKNNSMVIIVFSANFCKPSNEIYHHIKNLAEEISDIHFLKIDIKDGYEISNNYNIQSIPHFKFFKNNIEVFSFTGTNKNNLISSIKTLKEY